MKKIGRQMRRNATIVDRAAAMFGLQRFSQIRYSGSMRIARTAAQSMVERKGLAIARPRNPRPRLLVMRKTLGKVCTFMNFRVTVLGRGRSGCRVAGYPLY